MLINLSNHPSANWSEEQKAAATQYGEIVDLPFPAVDAAGDETYIATLADEYAEKVHQLVLGEQATIHLMGEMTLTFALLQRLKNKYMCVASTSERMVVEYEPGLKEVTFKFVKFRKYNI